VSTEKREGNYEKTRHRYRNQKLGKGRLHEERGEVRRPKKKSKKKARLPTEKEGELVEIQNKRNLRKKRAARLNFHCDKGEGCVVKDPHPGPKRSILNEGKKRQVV